MWLLFMFFSYRCVKSSRKPDSHQLHQLMCIEAGAGAGFDLVVKQNLVFPDLAMKTGVCQGSNSCSEFTEFDIMCGDDPFALTVDQLANQGLTSHNTICSVGAFENFIQQIKYRLTGLCFYQQSPNPRQLCVEGADIVPQVVGVPHTGKQLERTEDEAFCKSV